MINKEKIRERFEKKFVVTPGCWIWTSSLDGKGYGCFGIRRKGNRAHRISYELYVSDIPEGMHILHQCDNPLCVNPDHLKLGTHAQNMAEMKERGRRKGKCAGERSGMSKLTNDQARAIFLDPRRQVDIAKEYGITQVCVSQIKVGRSWTSVTCDLGARGGNASPKSKRSKVAKVFAHSHAGKTSPDRIFAQSGIDHSDLAQSEAA